MLAFLGVISLTEDTSMLMVSEKALASLFLRILVKFNQVNTIMGHSMVLRKMFGQMVISPGVNSKMGIK